MFGTRSLSVAAGCSLSTLAAATISLAASPAFNRRTDVVDTVERVGPAVVNISTEQRVQSPFGASAWDQMLREFFDLDIPGPSENLVKNSLGSGVIVDPSGYILTNEHVIERASRIRVTLSDKRQFNTEVVGTDPDSDLAVLKVDVEGALPSVPLRMTDDLLIGETAIAIGNPFGLSNTVSVGVISGQERSVQSGGHVYTDFIQTDAAINPGNSGGALLNINGELIGINTAIIGGATGIGFAIPASRASHIYGELVRYGEVRPIWLGLEAGPLQPALAKELGLRDRGGVVVKAVVKSGPAAAAGIEAGDVIIEADGRPIESQADLDTLLGRTNVGQKIPVTISRSGARRLVTLKAADFPYEEYAFSRMGIHVTNIDSAENEGIRRLPERGVVVVEVRPRSPAERLRLQRGDAIVQIGSLRVQDVEQFRRLIPRLQGMRSVYLGIVRGGYLYRVSLRLD